MAEGLEGFENGLELGAALGGVAAGEAHRDGVGGVTRPPGMDDLVYLIVVRFEYITTLWYIVGMKMSDVMQKVAGLAGASGAVIRTRDAYAAGIPVRGFREAIHSGALTKLARGLYLFSGGQPPGNPDLVMAARLAPRGVVCLLSALYHHGLTTQIPHAVSVAIRQHDQPPRPLPAHPPIQLFWFSGPAYEGGIDSVMMDGVPVRIYSPEKTLADIFKYRNKLGMDTALEALRLYKQRAPHPDIGRILKYARACRVEQIMRPYMESLL